MTAAIVISAALAFLFIHRKQPPPPRVPDVVGVIVSDPSNAAQHADFQAILNYAESKRDVLTVASARHPDDVQSISFAITGINDMDRQAKLKRAKDAAAKIYQTVAAPGGTADFQMSFNAVYDILHTIHHEKVLIAALGSMNEVARGVSLNDPITRGDPASSISSFQGGYVPSCSDWELDVAEGTAEPSALAEAQAREYWRKLMKSCGGQLTAWTIHVNDFPSTTAVAAWTGGGRCGITFDLEAQTLFNTGEYQIRPRAAQTLNRIISTAERADQPRLHIDGYTDSQGGSLFNKRLSENRALAVANWFTARGIGNSEVSEQGHGETDPIASNATAQGRQLNRRVEVTLTYSGCAQG